MILIGIMSKIYIEKLIILKDAWPKFFYIKKEEDNCLNIMTDLENYTAPYNVILDKILNSNTVNSRLFQVSLISSRAFRVFQVSRSPPRPTISLSRDVLRSARKK